jgi:hypothetical protein
MAPTALLATSSGAERYKSTQMMTSANTEDPRIDSSILPRLEGYYIKEGRVPSRRSSILPGNNTKRRAQYYSKQDVGYATLATRTCINLVSCVLAHTFGFQIMAPTFYLAAGTSYGG